MIVISRYRVSKSISNVIQFVFIIAGKNMRKKASHCSKLAAKIANPCQAICTDVLAVYAEPVWDEIIQLLLLLILSKFETLIWFD